MKTKGIKRLVRMTGLAVAVAFATGWIGTVGAADQTKGGEHQLNLLGIKTKAEADALKPGDAMAMVCTKCQSVIVTYIQKDMKGHVTRMVPGEKHLCPGCSSTIEAVGVGKAGKLEVKHVCKACGEDSVFCCATKPGSGATKGMEKK